MLRHPKCKTRLLNNMIKILLNQRGKQTKICESFKSNAYNSHSLSIRTRRTSLKINCTLLRRWRAEQKEHSASGVAKKYRHPCHRAYQTELARNERYSGSRQLVRIRALSAIAILNWYVCARPGRLWRTLYGKFNHRYLIKTMPVLRLGLFLPIRFFLRS